MESSLLYLFLLVFFLFSSPMKVSFGIFVVGVYVPRNNERLGNLMN